MQQPNDSDWSEPGENNSYLKQHVARLLYSFSYWTGRSLLEPDSDPTEQARRLFNAPFVVLSHNTARDPILNYANRAGLALFELSWKEMVGRPSRTTAEPSGQVERQRLLAAVARQGYIDNYHGVRVTNTGRRFALEEATVWNLIDERGSYYGQAALFSQWRFLDARDS